ncbi:MAG: dethiobiotin synthase [Paraglaciecola sp.]|uniref:dethiobiotin synthase n=1 Tax=Paraglaciecola sp. TaxID=1920173 RepID=UPI0032994C8C
MGNLSSNSRAFFITGTDTEVGKTFIGTALLKALAGKQYKTAAYKPIAAGCERTDSGLRNEDAMALLSNASLALSYDEVNPIALEPPIAPHLAADDAQALISLDRVREGFLHLIAKQPDVLIVEGAGGWRLPVSSHYDGKPRYLSEFVIERNLAVILVVGMRLGCLNHAVLTAESIQQDGLKIVGWVANQIDPNMAMVSENIESLQTLIDAPFLGAVPTLDKPGDAVEYIDLALLGL